MIYDVIYFLFWLKNCFFCFSKNSCKGLSLKQKNLAQKSRNMVAQFNKTYLHGPIKILYFLTPATIQSNFLTCYSYSYSYIVLSIFRTRSIFSTLPNIYDDSFCNISFSCRSIYSVKTYWSRGGHRAVNFDTLIFSKDLKLY